MPPCSGQVIVVVAAGIHAALRLGALGQVVLIEGIDGIAAIRRSWQLTRGHVWRLFRLAVLVFLVTLPVSIGAELLRSYTTVPALAAVAPVLTTLVTTPLFAIATTIAWADITRRPHPDNELVARGKGRGLAFAVLVVPGLVLAGAAWPRGCGGGSRRPEGLARGRRPA